MNTYEPVRGIYYAYGDELYRTTRGWRRTGPSLLVVLWAPAEAGKQR